MKKINIVVMLIVVVLLSGIFVAGEAAALPEEKLEVHYIYGPNTYDYRYPSYVTCTNMILPEYVGSYNFGNNGANPHFSFTVSTHPFSGTINFSQQDGSITFITPTNPNTEYLPISSMAYVVYTGSSGVFLSITSKHIVNANGGGF